MDVLPYPIKIYPNSNIQILLLDLSCTEFSDFLGNDQGKVLIIKLNLVNSFFFVCGLLF